MRLPLLVLVPLLLALGAAAAQPAQLGRIGVDVRRADIPIHEILSGGPPPNGIPALGFEGDWRGAARPTPDPKAVSVEQAARWLRPAEPVIAVTIGDDSRAYPLQILMFHEIANDELGGRPVAVTFCPLCNSALAFDRRVPLDADGVAAATAANPAVTTRLGPVPAELRAALAAQGDDPDAPERALPVTFGVSGVLFNSNLLMFDSQTSTLWSQILGAGNVGALTGVRLARYPAQIVSFEAFREAFPDGTVLSRDTGMRASYGRNPYPGYDSADQPPFLFRNPDFSFKDADGRLVAQARVVSVELGGEAVAYPFEELRSARAADDVVGGVPVAVFWEPGTASSLDAARVAEGRDVGAVGVFRREHDGRVLDFRWDEDAFVDEQTGSRWSLLGRATSGPLAGAQLEPIVHDNTLWFAWAAFKPETRVWRADGS